MTKFWHENDVISPIITSVSPRMYKKNEVPNWNGYSRRITKKIGPRWSFRGWTSLAFRSYANWSTAPPGLLKPMSGLCWSLPTKQPLTGCVRFAYHLRTGAIYFLAIYPSFFFLVESVSFLTLFIVVKLYSCNTKKWNYYFLGETVNWLIIKLFSTQK